MNRFLRTHLPEIRLSGLLRFALMTFILVVGTLQPGSTRAARSLAPSDTLVVGLSAEVINVLDPAIDLSLDMNVITGQIYETLTTYDAGSAALVPALATSWTVSADLRDWTFTLRSGVTFQDGTVFDADAVKFNFERWWDPSNPYHGAGTSYPYFESIFLLKNDPDGSLISGIDTSVDKTQVVIHLSQAYGGLPLRLSNPAFAIASPQAIINGTLSTHPVGTGAYEFDSWDTANQIILITAYPDYTGPQPFIPNIRFQQFGTYQEQVDAIKANNLHVAYAIPNAYYEAARQDMNVHVTWQLTSNIGYLGMNRSHGPLTSLLVRQAIAHAIDKQSLIRDYYDPVDQVANQFLPPEIWGNKPGMTDYSYDPDLARTLLSSAGYPQAFADPTITLEYRNVYRIYLRNPADVAVAIQTQLEAAGLQVNIQEDDPGVMVTRVIAGEPDMFLLGWGADYPHPDNFFYPHFCADFNLAFGARDDAFCTSLETTLAKTDYSAQLVDYQNASQYIHDQLPVVPLAYGRNMLLIRSEVAGLEKASFVPETFRTVFWADGPNEIFRPDQSGSLEVSGYQTPTTTINIPEGAVGEKVILSYSIVNDTAQASAWKPSQNSAPFQSLQASAPPSGMFAASPQFQISAYNDTVQQADLQFAVPIEIAIQYHTIKQPASPASLILYSWDGSQWNEATSTCTPTTTATLDTAKAALRVPVCSTGIFGLFGIAQIYLPGVQR